MKWIFILIICTILLIVHVCSIIVLVKSKQISKNRFVSFALYLSLSDACMMGEYIWHTMIQFHHDGSNKYLYMCMLVKHLIAGTVLFSLLQVLFICLERLNATIRTPSRILKSMTGDKAVGIALFLAHVYVLIRYFVDSSFGPMPCTAEYTIQKSFLLYIDTPCFILVLLIVLCYIGVIIRIIGNQRKVGVSEGTTDLQLSQREQDKIRIRKNITTLSFIVVVTVCSILPRTIFGLYLQLSVEPCKGLLHVISATNALILLNPLCDPFIYIFRFKQYRDYLKCKCVKYNHVTDTIIG